MLTVPRYPLHYRHFAENKGRHWGHSNNHGKLGIIMGDREEIGRVILLLSVIFLHTYYLSLFT